MDEISYYKEIWLKNNILETVLFLNLEASLNTYYKWKPSLSGKPRELWVSHSGYGMGYPLMEGRKNVTFF